MWFVGYFVLEVVEFIWTRVEARDRFYRGGCFDNETPLIEGVTTCAQMYLGVIERAPLVRSMWVIVAIAIHREHNRVRCLSKGQTAEQETKASTEDENTENEGLFHRSPSSRGFAAPRLTAAPSAAWLAIVAYNAWLVERFFVAFEKDVSGKRETYR